MDKTTEDVVKLLNTAFLKWQREQVKSGVPVSQASQNEFCRLYSIPNTTWSSWATGTRLPKDPASQRKLADVPYIGKHIYRTMGVPVPVEDKRLRYMNDHWDLIPEDIRDTLLNTFKDNLPNEDENLPSLT